MRRLADGVYRRLVAIHAFANRRWVRLIGSLIYIAGAVVVALSRPYLRALGLGRVGGPGSIITQLQASAVLGRLSFSSILRQAETLFH